MPQVWQWIKHKAQLKDTRIVDKQLVISYITEVVNKEQELKNSADIFAELCFNDKLVEIIEKYVHKGSKVYIEGQLETRKWTDASGTEKYSTEVVLRPYRGEIIFLDSKSEVDNSSSNAIEDDNVSSSKIEKLCKTL